jgi:hypothetical protein
MGGNLFKLGRLPRASYLALEADLRAILDPWLGTHYRIPRYYGSKADFGDVDILVSAAGAPQGWESLRLEIIDRLGVTEYKFVNRVLSLNFRGFQTDFFILPADEFVTTWQFMCYNDLGNLLGKLFRRFGLKYGETGLSYVYRRPDSDHYQRDLHLSGDMGRILDVLGLDLATWEAGFPTLEAMFAWVVSSPYFTVAPFLERKASTEKRVQHRPTMEKFVAWLEKAGVDKRYAFEEDRSAYLPMIVAAFPEADLPGQIAAEAARSRLVAEVQAKFSGKLVMEHYPELKGERLGRFIQQFKAGFVDFEVEVAAMSAEDVQLRLAEFWQTFVG